jgi:hypothetical protein
MGTTLACLSAAIELARRGEVGCHRIYLIDEIIIQRKTGMFPEGGQRTERRRSVHTGSPLGRPGPSNCPSWDLIAVRTPGSHAEQAAAAEP